MLGFIRRHCCDFKNIHCLKTISPWSALILNTVPYLESLQLGQHSLPFRRKFNDTSFIFKIIKGSVLCPEILDQIGWLVLTLYSISKTAFNESFHAQQFSFNEPQNRMLRACINPDNFGFNFDNESKPQNLCLTFD